jgi:hypothetical protein
VLHNSFDFDHKDKSDQSEDQKPESDSGDPFDIVGQL